MTVLFLKRVAAMTLFIIIGLVVLIISQKLPFHRLTSALFLVVVFIILNVAALFIFRINNAAAYYSLKKIPYFFLGILLGIIIHIIPFLVGYRQNFTRTAFNFSLFSFLVTFLIILWEELWFRNIFLVLFDTGKEKIILSIFAGLLFLVIHFLNPEFNIVSKGLNVFIGGAFLTFLFIEYKSFWLPLGLHFANNMIEAQIDPVSVQNAAPVAKFAMVHGSSVVLFIFYLILIFNKGILQK